MGLIFFVFGGGAVFFAWNAYRSVRDGRAWGFFLPGDRAANPILFWFAVSTLVFCASVCAFNLLWGTFTGFGT